MTLKLCDRCGKKLEAGKTIYHIAIIEGSNSPKLEEVYSKDYCTSCISEIRKAIKPITRIGEEG